MGPAASTSQQKVIWGEFALRPAARAEDLGAGAARGTFASARRAASPDPIQVGGGTRLANLLLGGHVPVRSGHRQAVAVSEASRAKVDDARCDNRRWPGALQQFGLLAALFL